jgi:hypothetical protein
MAYRTLMTEYGEIEIPGTLYKYRALSGGSRTFTSHIILKRELWWSPASDLNDDFDCNPVPKLTGSRLANEFWMRRTLRNAFPGMPSRDVKKVAAFRAGRPSHEFEAMMASLIEEARSSIGVCSLSSEPDRDELWMEYGGAHTGICLRFDDIGSDDNHLLVPDPHFGLAMRVQYTDARPEIPVYGDRGFDKLKGYLLTKTKKWDYEAEWRLVRQGFTGNMPFPPACLTGIIFGKDITPSDRDEVIRWAGVGGTSIEFLQAQHGATGIEICPWPIT